MWKVLKGIDIYRIDIDFDILKIHQYSTYFENFVRILAKSSLFLIILSA